MKKICVGSISTFLLIALSFIYSQKHTVRSVPPTSVKDTLSTSQLSFFGRLGIGNSANDSVLKISIGAGTTNPSKNTGNLFNGDIVGIGRSGGAAGLDMYTVSDIASTASFAITTPINLNNIDANGIVVATRSAIHTISFTPQSNITGGAWQFLIKATNRVGEKENDGMPDQAGFDLGADVGSTTVGLGTRLKATDISCPFGVASIGATITVNGNTYHNILCTLGAGVSNPIGVGVTVTIGRSLATGSQIINPSPSTTHIEGAAGPLFDVYTFFIRHLDAGGAVVNTDTAAGKIAVVESVRVTATVDPNLTFIIDVGGSLGLGSTACGNTGGNAFAANAANTTATAVSFGSLSGNAFNNLGQRLSALTNSNGGYVVTVFEETKLRNLTTGVTIPDTTCDAGTCTYTTAQPWTTDNTHSKWGYTLQNLSVGITSTTFTYTNGYKAFGVGFAQAQPIMTNPGTPSTTEQAFICYRLTAANSQQAGSYENKLTYTATATF